MSEKSHAGDWLFIIAGGRMVAVTPDAYDQARALWEPDAPALLGELHAKGRALGDLIKAALDVLERSGTVRLELRPVVGRDDFRWPVYALVPPEDLIAEPAHQRARRGRRKPPAATKPPELVLIEGSAGDPVSGEPRGG